eukprot:264568_1
MNTLKIGDEVDVQLEDNTELWYIQTVTKVNDTSITTMDIFGQEETIDKSSNRLATVNSHTVKLLKLSPLPKHINWADPKPIYDATTNGLLLSYIFPSENFVGTQQYHIESDTYEPLSYCGFKYSHSTDYYTHALQSDEKVDILYILFHTIFMKVDLETNTVENIAIGENVQFNESEISSCFLPSINEFHALNNDIHCKYDQLQNKLIKISTTPLVNSSLIYVSSLRKLFVFGGHTKYDEEIDDFFWKKDIYSCDVYGKNQNIYEWKKVNLELPFEEGEPYIFCVAFDHILFIFNDEPNVWAIDLCYMKLFKYNGYKHIGYLTDSHYVIKGNNNNIHMMYHSLFPSEHKYHYVFSLYEVIPKSMKQFYLSRYKLLVFGFIKKMQQTELLSISFPIYFIELILSYFPLFL